MKNFKLFFLFSFSLLFFSNLSLQASFSKEELERLQDVNHSNIKTILEKYIAANAEVLNFSRDKNIVAFIGKTGSGKSTLINYLNNKQLVVDDMESIVLSNSNDPTSMKIGVESQSETFLPQYISNQGLLFCDLPGIGETRGTAVSLINACFIKSVIENAKTTRLIFVIGQDEVTAERGKSFKELCAMINRLIPNEVTENFSSIVVTKSTPGTNNQRLIDRLSRLTDAGVLDPWTQAGRLTHMSAPFGKQINQDDKTEILQVIRKTPSKKINNIDISVIYNSQEQDKIRDIYAGEIEEIFNALIRENINERLIPSLDIDILERKKSYFRNNFFNELKSLLDNLPLITLLRPFSNDIYISYWDEVKENKQTRIQNILEKIKTSKAEQLYIEEKRLRIQAEQAWQEERQRRIEAEKALRDRR